MQFPLKQKEKRRLILQHKKERDRYARDRIKAILAYDEGYSYSEIARLLLLDDETIRRYIKSYRDKHVVDQDKRGGSESHLNDDQTQALIAHLKKKTYQHVALIVAYVKTTWGVKYTVSGMTKWLQAQGFCYKKPKGVPGKIDPEAQSAFIERYKQLKAKLPGNEVICFADATHPEHQTRPSYGWIYRGVTKTVAMTAYQKRVHMIGAIDLCNQQVTYMQSEKINGDSVKIFLEQLSQRYPDKAKIHVFLDNASPHHRKDVKTFAEEHRIKLHYLPPYSPNLNPIERLWKIMHERTTRNRYYEKFVDFAKAIDHFFRHINKKKRLLKSRINDNFQILDKPNFAV